MLIPDMIVSPCQKICTLDARSALCGGCGRSLAEIEHWTRYTDGERAQVMAELPQRLARMAYRKLQAAGRT